MLLMLMLDQRLLVSANFPHRIQMQIQMQIQTQPTSLVHSVEFCLPKSLRSTGGDPKNGTWLAWILGEIL
jgi:hypothetical protein